MLTAASPTEAARRRERGRALQQEIAAGEPPDARFHVLSSFNVDLLPPMLVEALERSGTRAEVTLGEFGQIAQEALQPDSGLYRAEPDAVVVVPAVEDMLGPLFEGGPASLAEGDAEALVDQRLAELSATIDALLDRLVGVTCYLVVFGTHRAPFEHVLDPGAGHRGQAAVERFQAGVRTLGERSERVLVVDWDWHVRSVGSAAYGDDRLWYLGRMRLAPTGLAALGELVAQHVAAYRGEARKVVAVDLDGTVWGGVVGEVGLQGLELGEEGLGLAFQDLQRELRKLHDAGVLLVACSKNNPEDVHEAFERHHGMVLRREHLVAERVNWQDKATNLRELAAELNLGLDSFVFLDDNPVERDWVSRSLPQVAVPDLPEDPARRPAFLRDLPHFRRITVTDADTQRAGSYRAQGSRLRLRSDTLSFDEFLRSLEQEVTIEAVHDGSVARAAQLCQRTNQFNLTTRRHTVADIERMRASDEVELYTLALQDRFGDSGITGLAILRFEDEEAEVDTLLMSCRVLGRRVEDAFLSFLGDRARARGAHHLAGRYLPTPKNAQVERFYPDRDFEATGEGAYRLDLSAQAMPAPPEIALRVPANA